jgi:Ion channel
MAALLGLWRMVMDYVIAQRVISHELEIHRLLAIFTVMLGGAVGEIVEIYFSLSAWPATSFVLLGLLLRCGSKKLGCDLLGGSMTQTHRIAILAPLAVGMVAVICTIMIHSLPLGATVNFVRRERKLGRAGTNFWIDMGIVALAILSALAAHVIEIALWAVLYVICGEFADFGTAYYHSAVNYTSLGYGDLIMSPSWKLLGPLETANAMLLFGVSTAMIFAVIQRLVEARFVDLKDGMSAWEVPMSGRPFEGET